MKKYIGTSGTRVANDKIQTKHEMLGFVSIFHRFDIMASLLILSDDNKPYFRILTLSWRIANRRDGRNLDQLIFGTKNIFYTMLK